ncbi:PhoH family protein [Actinomycetaceae bacterium MB13-C1-2]|nr:PhoH family protein [Actinomycetaceae bacterium MB13-C1-2]
MTELGSRSLTRTIEVPQDVELVSLLGPSDRVIRVIEKGFPGVSVLVHGRIISVAGSADQVGTVAKLVEELVTLARQGTILDADAVTHAVDLLRSDTLFEMAPSAATGQAFGNPRRNVKAKTPGQQNYMDALSRSQIVFGIGPAGTGKTYLAMAEAVDQLLSGQVRRVILTRPAVEAGENLGFLPGSLSDKIDPYLRPLYDALQDLLEEGSLPRLMEAGAVEVAPLAYMRGRTLNDSFVIVDEAQNTTAAQMKMLLTRLGEGSKMAVTGDVTQVDLRGDQKSGLIQAEQILRDIDGIGFQYLTSADVVRTRLVADIVDAYDEWDTRHPQNKGVASRKSGSSSRSRAAGGRR